MAILSYYANGKLCSMNTQMATTRSAGARAPGGSGAMVAPRPTMLNTIQAQKSSLAPFFHALEESTVRIAVPKDAGPVVMLTETMVIDGAKSAEVQWLRDQFGMTIIEEGRQGKVLLLAPEGGEEGIRLAFASAQAVYERGNVNAAHPNFVRILSRISASAPRGVSLWNHANDGALGVPGADVAALAAWTITKGNPDIRVAVLDEGVDTLHPALLPAVVAETDFVNGNPHARPDGNDAHGTACAGIIVSQDHTYPGLAPRCSLVAARIARGDDQERWIFNDFKTADAIDWAWEQGRADVLSNSWGGGPPVDVITRAFVRARTQGRGGKRTVVVMAAGNNNGPVQFPGTLSEVITVGASNPWDERKAPDSQDGETWWGSCYGRPLNLLAPGVRIATTDLSRTMGYSSHDFIETFNGTSAATPHVAAAAALILSVVPEASEQKVRDVINATADRLTANGKWNKYVGWGRLNIFNALRRAWR